MDPKETRIFVSYRRGDSPGHAGWLSDALEAVFGESNVFRDTTSITGGSDFSLEIDEAIKKSDLVVAVVGPRWLGRFHWVRPQIFRREDWVRLEIEKARSNGKPILPVLVSNAKMPGKRSLPESITFFSSLQATPLRDESWDQDLARVIQEIRGLISKPASLPPVSREQTRPATASRRLALRLLLVPFGAMAGWGLWKILYDNDRPSPPVQPSDTRTAIVRIGTTSNGGAQAYSTGFFITPDGHILALLPNFNINSLVVTTDGGQSYSPRIVERKASQMASLSLLKIDIEKAEYVSLALREPHSNQNVVTWGADQGELDWEPYSAKVDMVTDGRIRYKRLEEGWLGMMGAPIFDRSDNAVIGVHEGKDPMDRTAAYGRTLKSLGVQELLQKASLQISSDEGGLLNLVF